jgi:predicted XRE-type DNA-binding protein
LTRQTIPDIWVVSRWHQELEARKISQADAANVLGVTQPKVFALRRYTPERFSVERLMNLLAALDQDVEIVIRRTTPPLQAPTNRRL